MGTPAPGAELTPTASATQTLATALRVGELALCWCGAGQCTAPADFRAAAGTVTVPAAASGVVQGSLLGLEIDVSISGSV